MAGRTPTALILGVTGQDGALLANKLLAEDWLVYGGFRRRNPNNFWRLEELGIQDQLKLVPIDLQEPHQVVEVLSSVKPDRIYHFAGESNVSNSFQHPRTALEINTVGTLNVLEAMRLAVPDARMFFPSSSEVFGEAKPGEKITENTRCRPLNPYGVARLAAQNLVSIYRKHHDLHISVGVLFNHEGPFRGLNFVTRKITHNLARLSVHGGEPMLLGNFEDARDWGSAEDYVGIMPNVLDLDAPEDFVFATGKVTTIRAFLEIASEFAGFAPVFEGTGQNTVCIDRKSGMTLAESDLAFFRRTGTPPLVGNPGKLLKATGHNGSRNIEAIAEEMIEADLRRVAEA